MLNLERQVALEPLYLARDYNQWGSDIVFRIRDTQLTTLDQNKGNAKSSKLMLFKDTKRLAEYAQLVGKIDFTSIKATLQFVEQNHLLPILGTDLFNTLQDAYNTAAIEADIAPDTLLPLLEKCRQFTAPLFCYFYAPKADVVVSDSGVQRIETGSNKTAFQYQTTNYIMANQNEAMAGMEVLLQFLEDNSTVYTQWSGSSAFISYNQLFIKNGKDFDTLYTSHTPYRNYYAMRSKMVDVEENNIRDVLGNDLFDALKTIDSSGLLTYTEIQQKLVDKLKKAIAYFTVAYAIPHLNVRIDSNGISVVSARSNSGNDKENTRAAADGNAIDGIIKSCLQGAEIWIKSATTFIQANPASFASWKGFVPASSVPDTISNANNNLTSSFGLI